MSNAADLVSIIGPNGESSTQDGNTDGNVSTVIGLITNNREFGFNGTEWDRLRTVTSATDAYPGTGLMAMGQLGLRL